MSQMVLPQNLPKSAPSEVANGQASNRAGKDKSGDSAFDAVSRSEQQRLEAKEARNTREARDGKESQQTKTADSDRDANTAASNNNPAEKSGADSSVQSNNAGAGSDGANQTDSGERSEAAGQNLAADRSGAPEGLKDPEALLALDGSVTLPGEPLAPAEEGNPVTFAGLQALVAPGPGPTAGTPAGGPDLPFMQGSMMSMAGMNGNGKNAVMTLQSPGQNASPSSMALTESLLAGVTADGGKSSDTSILQTAVRFQGALESASAQANAVNTPKMAPDAAALRGYTTSIDVPVSHAEWGDKVAGKLTWLTARNMSVAEIHLTPPDMGPMEVRVQVQQDQANITVHSANAAVRDQLELHSHRLRDMLSEQGLSLENFDVSDSGRDQTRDGEAGGDGQSGESLLADAESDENAAGPQSLDLSWKGEVDIFA